MKEASYVLVIPKLLAPFIRLGADSGEKFFHPPKEGFRNKRRKIMEEVKKYIKKKGGRPQKAIKRDQLVGVKFTMIEKKLIEFKAKTAGLTHSEYLREMGLSGKIDMHKKAL